MPMSLPVGQFSWGDRWVCSGDEEMLPYETETHSSKRLNDPAFLSEPARPMKARHPSDIPSSVYTETLRAPNPNFRHKSQHEHIAEQIARQANAKTMPAANKQDGIPFDPMAHSQQLWMRVNPGFYQPSLKTENSTNYVDHAAEAHPLDRTHHVKSCAMAPAQRNPVTKMAKPTK